MQILTYQQIQVLINAFVKVFNVLIHIPLDGKNTVISALSSEYYTEK